MAELAHPHRPSTPVVGPEPEQTAPQTPEQQSAGGGPAATAEGIVAVPSASPLVTPEMAERLCRMASQHYNSDYNRFKRQQTPFYPPGALDLASRSQPPLPAAAHPPLRGPRAGPSSPTPTPHSALTTASAPRLKRSSLKAPSLQGRSHSAPAVGPRAASLEIPRAPPPAPPAAAVRGREVRGGVAAVVGGYFSAWAGQFGGSAASTPPATPPPAAAGTLPQGEKRKASSRSPLASTVALPVVAGLGYTDSPKRGGAAAGGGRDLADEEGAPRMLAAPVLGAMNGGAAPTSVPMAMADSSESTAAMIMEVQGHKPVPARLAAADGAPKRASLNGARANGRTATPTNGLDPNMVKTSETHPMNISPVLPPELLGLLGQLLLPALCVTSADAPVAQRELFVPIDMHDLTGSQAAPAYELLLATTHSGPQRRMGNMLLSSCPGKKIRLENNSTPAERAANGHRAAICRDLKSDFNRARTVGVKAVICCIDDAELKFLGSPWDEYLAAATECGMEVLRLPMAEGYAPHSVSDMDHLLDVVIQRWTSKGEDVLCHCRGGVGRAGLVACCWMMRCGLVRVGAMGTPPVDKKKAVDGADAKGEQRPAPPRHPVLPRPEVFRQVEKVVEVIRRRRSCKAIETPHQVHFVMEMAAWIDDRINAGLL